MLSVLICDDRHNVREGLRRALAAVPDAQQVECVATVADLVDRYTRRPADAVLVGAERAGGSGLEAARRLVARHPAANLVVVGSSRDPASVLAALAAGARGYLRWDVSRLQLVLALSQALSRDAVAAPRAPTSVRLTDRELEVLRGISEGMSNEQIGRVLFLSENTVKTHSSRVFRKLGVTDRAQAVAHGFRLGLVS